MSQNIKKTTIFLFIIRLLKIAFNIFTLAITSKYFGVSVKMDVWIIVSTIITTVNLTIWGPLNETFRAKFVFLMEHDGEKTTLYKVRSLLLSIFLITIAISIILALLANHIIPFVAPSLSSSQKVLFVKILLIMIPSFVISEMTSIGVSILNAYKVFYMPEIVGVVSGLVNLICVILFASSLGISSLILGQYISSLILITCIVIFIRNYNINLWSGGVSISWKEVKPFIYFAIPFFLPYGVGQFNNLLEKSLSNSLGIGTVSILNYGSQFKNVLQAVFTSVLASVMVPSLTLAWAQKNSIAFFKTFKDSIQIVLLTLSLATPIIYAGSSSFVNILYNHGGITAESLEAISHLIRIYCVSIFGVMFYLLFGFALLAQQQSSKYAIQGVISQIMMGIFNVLFYKKIGVSIFPVSLFVSHFVVSILMFKSLNINNKKNIIIETIRYIILIVILTFLLTFISQFVYEFIKTPLIQLTVIVFVLLILFIIFSRIIGFNLKTYYDNIKKSGIRGIKA